MKKNLCGTPKHLSEIGALFEYTYLMLTLPFKCNYRCPKCFNLKHDHPVANGNPLTTSVILEAIRDARDLGGRVVVIAGEGEPSFDPNIREIISTIDGLGMIPIVYSNGSSLSAEIVEFYRRHNTCIVVALDSLKHEVHQKLAGTSKSMLDLVLGNVAYLREVYKDSKSMKKDYRVLKLAINMTLSSENKGEIKAIKEYAGEDMYFICNPLAKEGNAVDHWGDLITDSFDHSEQVALVRKYSESGGPLTLDAKGLCGYSINGIGIGPYGEFMTCAYTMKTNGLLGNINDVTLKKAYEIKNKIEAEHYKQYGNKACMIRSEEFNVYVESLSKRD